MRTKRIFTSWLLFMLLGFHALPAHAAPSLLEAPLTFEDLGLETDMLLRGPYDSNGIRFDLPPAWSLMGGSALQLEITTFIAGGESQPDSASAPEGASRGSNDYLGAVLEVYFNDELQQSISLVEGENITYTILLNSADLVSPYEAGWHKLSFFLDATIDCDYEFHQTTVIINSKSMANFQYRETAPELDLHRLPWPIYQERAKIIDPAYVVIPSDPSAQELQGALTVMGAFGRMSLGKLPLEMLTEDLVTDQMIQASNLIFVGKAASFAKLQGVTGPIQFSSSGFNSPEVGENDGVLQLIASPWNQTKTILMVSGNTDEGVVKAAQALSTGNIQTSLQQTYSVVAQVNPLTDPGVLATGAALAPAADFTFGDLGYAFFTVNDVGANYLTYEFAIPQGQIPSEQPHLDLKYSASALADVDRSGIIIYLNDVLIGSVRFPTEGGSLSTSKIDLPLSALRPGINRIDVVISLIPINECSVLSFSGIWTTVYPDSLIHLPLMSASETPFTLGDLNNFPYPFTSDPTLSATAFVLPPADRDAWFVAGNIAYSMSALIPGPILAPNVYFDTQLPENYRENNLVLVGEPKDLPVVSELKESLPAYFEPGSNIAVLTTQQVVYRISDQKSLGYLELFPSPWASDKAVMGVFGTTSEGLQFAQNSLGNPLVVETFAGNFVTLDAGKAIVVDTETGLGTGRIQPALGPDVVTEEDNPTPVEDLEAQQDEMRRLILYIAAGVLVLMAVVATAAFRLRRKNAA